MNFLDNLSSSIQYLKGVGEKRALLFKKLGIETVEDLLYHFPRNYIDCSGPVEISKCTLDEYNCISGVVSQKKRPVFTKGGVSIYKIIFTDYTDDISVVIFNSEYLYNSLEIGKGYCLYGKITKVGSELQISSPLVIPASQEEKILPQYPLTEGLSQKVLSSCIHNALKVLDEQTIESLPKDILNTQELSSLQFSLQKIHFPKDSQEVVLARKRLVFDELLHLSLGLSMIKNRRKNFEGSILQDVSLNEFYNSLPFELTNSQKSAINDCALDMQKKSPMSRLVQGDVGSGKTVIAAACCYFAVKNGYQSALMAPTEILANQHYKTLTDFLVPLGIKVGLLTGSLSSKSKKNVKEKIENGEYDVVVGTHALIQTSTVFKNLALVITDEQHRFGVNQRDTLTKKGNSPHVLIMSATPIPRTLALMIYGDMEISVLKELPKGRIPIETYAVTGKLRERAFNFVENELKKGRQCYIVCPAIDENEADLTSVKTYFENIISKRFDKYNISLLHGKMLANEKDVIMNEFKSGKINILVSTTVIEVGVDVPNATIILIENADRFGLSQLHQLRGRVGRGKEKSYCVLITDNVSQECKERLKILSKTVDGFEISEADLKMRGPGDFFGNKQHGLPKLKIADLASDIEVMKTAQAVAKKILSQDSKLIKSENKGLNKAVALLFEKFTM